VPDEHPAIAAAEQIVRAYHDEMLRSAMLYQIREYKQELDGLAADAPADIWAIAAGSLKTQVELYRQTWGAEPAEV
jgi:hypothetical protein